MLMKIVLICRVHPGISTYADSPTAVGEHLEPLLSYALKQIPTSHQPSTPLFLLATAGMRLLSPAQQEAILSFACAYTRQRTPFLLPDCDAHFQVIDGTTEGLYGWIAINYLLGSFDRPELHNHGKGHSS
jgi:Golgi nucleoside diphosphatase